MTASRGRGATVLAAIVLVAAAVAAGRGISSRARAMTELTRETREMVPFRNWSGISSR